MLRKNLRTHIENYILIRVLTVRDVWAIWIGKMAARIFMLCTGTQSTKYRDGAWGDPPLFFATILLPEQAKTRCNQVRDRIENYLFFLLLLSLGICC